MKTNDQQTTDKKPEQKGADPSKAKDPAVQRGQAAIEARKAVDPDPEDVKKAKEEKDAEQWRNEG